MSDSKRLLYWYDRHRRRLPWRTDPPDPYRTLVSEIMLQQTRVETVLPYFERFLERFPSPQALAEADEDEVLVHWTGLGYYRRARQLHSAAKAIVARGTFPSTMDTLRLLPGVGEYTAAAVASIAFGLPLAVVDGNVERVHSRRLGIREGRRARARRRIRAAAQVLVDPRRPGDSNQAMMELGATVCTPRAPRCESCPLRSGCLAFERGRATEYPAPRRRRAPERLRLVAALVRRADGRILLVRRPAGDEWLAGAWELPWVPEPEGRAKGALGERYGGTWLLGEPICSVRHTVTHRRLEIELREAGLDGTDAVGEGIEARWASEAEIAGLPRATLVDKLLRGAAKAR